ncbi:MAG TPA: DUF2491 family protein [Dokdonella sp.]
MSAFGRARPRTDAATFPLGARLGGAVVLDATPFKLAGDAFAFACPEGAQIIEAIGAIDLGAGARLHRLYLSDDAFVQIATTGAATGDLGVGEIALFVYADAIAPADQAAFRRWVEPGSPLGAATYAFAGHEYRRVWGDDPELGWAPPVALDEDVYKISPDAKDYDLTLYSMLYARDVDGGRGELLLVSAEDAGPNDYCISLALGVALTRADFEIT